MNIPDVSRVPFEDTEKFSRLSSWCEDQKALILSEMQHSDGQEFVSAIGFFDFMRILERFGGTEIYLAEVSERSGGLAAYLDAPNRAALLERFGPGRIPLPSLRSVLAAIQRAAVRLMIEDGLATGQIARRMGLSDRWVRTVRARIRTEKRKFQLHHTKHTAHQLGETGASELVEESTS